MVKNPSTRPPQNYYRGPLSESVHEMDGLSPKSWSLAHLDRWTDGRSADGRLRPKRPGPAHYHARQSGTCVLRKHNFDEFMFSIFQGSLSLYSVVKPTK